MQKYHGIWTALITPFNENQQVDYEALRKIIRHQVKAGVTGLVPCGTTGESPTLSLEEKKKIISFTQEELKSTDVGIIAGTGSNSTLESIELSKWASDQGVQAVLVVTPYYNKPSQSGLIQHFEAIANAVDCDVILYNVPCRTAVSLSIESIIHLAKHPNINAIKEASADMALIEQLAINLKEKNLNLQILSGDDATFYPSMKAGSTGVISVTSNLVPQKMVELYSAAQSNKRNQAEEIHNQLTPLFNDLFIESNPTPIKTAMANAGWCLNNVRLPLAPLEPSNLERLNQTLSEVLQ